MPLIAPRLLWRKHGMEVGNMMCRKFAMKPSVLCSGLGAMMPDC